MKTSIIDTPIESYRNGKNGENGDKFSIAKYEQGLVRFIEGAETPLTIALQGSWGSGKTSLMNALEESLCKNQGAKFKSVWINTWEYSLMSNQELTLLQLLSKMISEVLKVTNSNNDTKKQILQTTEKLFKGLIRTGLAVIGNGNADALDDIFNEDNDATIGKLKEELKTLIQSFVAKHKEYSGVIFFIDDLDRINPVAAVQLMELMKNIFTLENCIFVLAIDYNVVVKGLKPKFGELSENNEYEFRSFFDKIIQVPFSMPVSQYEIEDFVFDTLKNAENGIGYFENINESELEKIRPDIIEIVKHSVGTNPRSIKRLINSTSLVKCIFVGQEDSLSSLEDLFLNFAFIALQVVYNKFYEYLNDEPNFLMWHEKLLSKKNIPKLTVEEISKFSELADEYIDEEWEMAIFKLCEKDNFLKANFRNISEIFNIIKKHAVKTEKDDNGRSIEILDIELIKKILKLSASTNIKAEVQSSNTITEEKMYEKIIKAIKDACGCEEITTNDNCHILAITADSADIRCAYRVSIDTNALSKVVMKCEFGHLNSENEFFSTIFVSEDYFKYMSNRKQEFKPYVFLKPESKTPDGKLELTTKPMDMTVMSIRELNNKTVIERIKEWCTMCLSIYQGNSI